MADARHHHAHTPAVIIVPVPVAGPDFQRQAKPRYPRQDRPQPWKPAKSIPGREPEGLRRLLDFMRRRDDAARAMLRPDMTGIGAFMRLRF
jgi:hypothetical protein